MSSNSMELFFQACGWKPPFRLCVEPRDPSLASEQVLHQPFALVGNDPRMDLRLHDPKVNRRHAYLQLLGGKVFCVDLQSRLGIQLQGRTKRSEIMEPGENLGIGSSWIRVVPGEEDSPTAADFPTSESGEDEALPEVALEFVNRLPGPTVWRMTTALALVGKASLCRVRLVGASVSKFHCSLVRTPLGLWVVDLFGKGGIRVNERPVRSARLEEGDRLQVGNFIIRTRYLQPAPARFPFSHLADVTGPIDASTDSGFSLPALQDALTHLSANLTQEETPVPFSLSGPSNSEPPAETALSLAPPWTAIPSESVPMTATNVQALLVPMAQQLGMIQHQMFEQFQQAMMMMFQMFGKLQKEQLGVIRDEMEHLRELSREILTVQKELAKQPPAAPAKPQHAPAAPTPRAAPASAPHKPAPRSGPSPKEGAQSRPLPLPQPPPPEKNVHAWLIERLATLQEERQSRWQKIMSFLAGKASEKANP